jgi:lipopolysaccharide export system permease protein
MTSAELWQHLSRMSRAGYDSAPLAVALHEKLVLPLLPLILVLVGIPIAVSGWQRKGSLYGFGVALLIVFGFWAVWAVTTGLGREGALNPIIAGWGPPLVLGGAGVWLLLRAR